VNAPEFLYVITWPPPRSASGRPSRRGAFTRQYWFGRWVESDWRVGSLVNYWTDEARGDLDFSGKVLRSEPPRVLSYTFGVEWGRWVRDSAAHRDMLHERPSRVTFELEPMGAATKLTLLHDQFEPGGTSLQGISRGWPAILSALKSVLEGGTSLVLDPKKFG
jgi:uncharacterized protein YndB with AHSA1/START domain